MANRLRLTRSHINDFLDNGFTKEEMKMVWETHRILEDEGIQVSPTCVRIPVFYGHSKPSMLRQKPRFRVMRERCYLTYLA